MSREDDEPDWRSIYSRSGESWSPEMDRERKRRVRLERQRRIKAKQEKARNQLRDEFTGELERKGRSDILDDEFGRAEALFEAWLKRRNVEPFDLHKDERLHDACGDDDEGWLPLPRRRI